MEITEQQRKALMRRAESERDQAIAAAYAAYAAQARLLGWEDKPPEPQSPGTKIDSGSPDGDLIALAVTEAVRKFIATAASRFDFYEVVAAVTRSGIPAARSTIARAVARAVIAGDIRQVERGRLKMPAVYAKQTQSSKPFDNP